MFQQDWILNQIEQLAAFIAKVIFKKDTTTYRIENNVSHTDIDCLHFELLDLLKQKRINDAEDMLFDWLQADDIRYLEVAVDFYARLNAMSDDELESADFSREEVEEGLKLAAAKYGVRLP